MKVVTGVVGNDIHVVANRLIDFFEKKEGKKKILENNRLVHKI